MWHGEYVKWRYCAGVEVMIMHCPVWAMWPWPWANIYALAWTTRSTSPCGPEGARESGSGGPGWEGRAEEAKGQEKSHERKTTRAREKGEGRRERLWGDTTCPRAATVEEIIAPNHRIWSVNYHWCETCLYLIDKLSITTQWALWQVITISILCYEPVSCSWHKCNGEWLSTFCNKRKVQFWPMVIPRAPNY